MTDVRSRAFPVGARRVPARKRLPRLKGELARGDYRWPEVVAILVPMLLLMFATSCATSPRSVVLISIDTLRPDHLGCYGYAPPTSPELDALRQGGVVFRSVVSHAPSTLLSHASMLSSKMPQHHGATLTNHRALPEEIETLAEVFQTAGWVTAAFVGGGQLAPEFGLDQGFEQYTTLTHRFSETVDAAGSWITGVGGRPFFLFLHSYEVHHPYTPPSDVLRVFDGDYSGDLPDGISVELLKEVNSGRRTLTDSDRRHVIAAYDAEIRSMDAALGRLVHTLKEQGRLDSTLIIFTSDHGEEFGEHGWMGWHSHTLHRELLRVPLVLWGRGLPRGAVVEQRVRLIDLAPTVLDFVGMRVPIGFEGVSLLPLLSGGSTPTDVVAYGESRDKVMEGIVIDHWKLYDGRLFDLHDDPWESTDVRSIHPDVARRLEAELRHAVGPTRALGSMADQVDESTRQQLEALGYVERAPEEAVDHDP